MLYEYRPRTLVKWILEFLRIRGVNFHGKFGLGIPNYNNSGSKNQEIPIFCFYQGGLLYVIRFV